MTYMRPDTVIPNTDGKTLADEYSKAHISE